MALQILMFLVSYALLIVICRIVLNRFEFMAELGNKAQRNRMGRRVEEAEAVQSQAPAKQRNFTRKAA